MPSTRSPRLGAAALVLDRVSRSYGDAQALAPVTLTVDAGAVAVVRGENGAGKTTLLRVAAGLLRPSAGSRHCTGRAVYLRPGGGARAAERVREAVGFAVATTGSAAQPDDVLDRAGLAELAGRRVGTLSAGQRARLCVALALATAPALACLDEPTASLDDDGRERTCAALRALAHGGTAVLVATHDAALAGAGWDADLRLRSGAVLA